MSWAESTPSGSTPFWKNGGQKARHHRRARHPVLPADDSPALQARPEEVVIGWSVDVVADVLLAGPHHLDRTVDLLGDPRGAVGHVRLEPSAEAAADQMIVHGHLAFRQARGLGHGGVHALDHLGADPHLGRRRRDVHGAVQRLHAGVRQQRHLEGGGDNFVRCVAAGAERLLDVADLLGDRARPERWPAQPRPDRARRTPRRSARRSSVMSSASSPHLAAHI